MNSDTPRTDAAAAEVGSDVDWPCQEHMVVSADFARQLERENAALRSAAEQVYDRLHDLGCFTDEQEILRASLKR